MQQNSTINAQHANTIIHAGDAELLHMQQETALWEKSRFAGTKATNNEDILSPFLSLRVTSGEGLRHASVSAKAWGFVCRYAPLLRPHRSPRQVGFLAFWGRFAPGGAVAWLASARVGVALAKPPAMPKRA